MSKGLENTKTHLFLGFVTKVDPLYNTIEIDSALYGKIYTQYNPVLGLEKDDLVLVSKIEGFFSVIEKTIVDYDEKQLYVIDTEKENIDERIKEINSEDLPEEVKYPADFYIKKEEGDKSDNVSTNGYRITKKFIEFFSGLATMRVDFNSVRILSKAFLFFGIKTKALFKVTENKTEDNSYALFIPKNNNKPYLINIKGDVRSALFEHKIEVELPIPIENIVLLNAVISDTKDIIYDLTETSYVYDDNKNTLTVTDKDKTHKISREAINLFTENINKKLYKYFSYECVIDGNKYQIVSYEAIDKKGNKYNFNNNVFNVLKNKEEIIVEKEKIYSSDTMRIWGKSMYIKNTPISESPWYMEILYKKAIINFYCNLQVNVSEAVYLNSKNTTLNTYKQYKSYFNINTNIVNAKSNVINISLDDSLEDKAAYLLNIKDSVNIVSNKNNIFVVQSLKSGDAISFSITKNNNVYFTKTNQIYSDCKTFIVPSGQIIAKSLYIKKYLIVKDVFTAFEKGVYLTAPTTYIKADNIFYVDTEKSYLKAKTNIVLYIEKEKINDEDKNTTMSYISMSKSSIIGNASSVVIPNLKKG